MNRKRGFTLIELLVVIAIIALLVGLLLPALAKAKRNAASLKDAAQLKEIHQSMLVYANEHNDTLPTPGLINRLADIYLGAERPGIGPEDYVLNTSANVYSAMIAQEYFNPDICISPTEVNPKVKEYTSYDYAQYNPGSDEYWDSDFSADISASQDEDSNTSFYHLALVGIRKKLKWRNTADNNDAIMSSRAPYEGRGPETDDYTKSQTLLLHGPKKSWVGNVCHGDNHTQAPATSPPAHRSS